MTDTPLTVAGRVFNSRLIIGTGKYASYAQNAEAARAAGAEMVTVALRRVNLSNPDEDRLQDHVSPDEFTYLPNTAGCFTADEAVRTLRLAREAPRRIGQICEFVRRDMVLQAVFIRI